MITLALCLLAADPDLILELRSDRASHFYFEGETPLFVASVKGGHPAALEWRVEEHDGAWEASGRAAVAEGADLSKLTVSPPVRGRGLYRLSVRASAGGTTAYASTRFAIVFAPPKADPASRWGLFTIPYDGEVDEAKSAELAKSHRALGCSWTRLNFWSFAFEDLKLTGKPDDPVSVSFKKYRSIARALRREGISIMGEHCMMPRVLSSRPDAEQTTNEGAPIYARVKPRDYREWDALVERMAREFKDEIQAWETWNEANGADFWLGTPEEWAELVRHTAAAIKKGNPKAQVVLGSFTSFEASRGGAFLERALAAGVGPHVDAFSIHAGGDDVPRYRGLISKFGIPATVPIWDTEIHRLLDLDSTFRGVARQFHFFHRRFGTQYDAFPALVDRDMTPTLDGVTYATSVHVLGEGEIVDARSDAFGAVYVAKTSDGMSAAWRDLQAGLLPGRVTLSFVPLPGRTPELLDAAGRATPATMDERGLLQVPVSGVRFLRGAKSIKIADYTGPRPRPDPEQTFFSATKAAFTGSWQIRQPGPQNHPPADGIPRPFVELFSHQKPGPEGYALAFTLDVPRDGDYQVLLVGLTTNALLVSYRWMSPFAWSLDGGAKTVVDGRLKSYWTESRDKYVKNQLVRPADMTFTGGGDLYQELTTTKLSKGPHQLRIELIEPRSVADRAWTQVIESIVLRPVTPRPSLSAAEEASGPVLGAEIALENGGFEFTPDGKDGPAGVDWFSDAGTAYYVGRYPSAEGRRSANLFPESGTQDILCALPVPRIEHRLGRALRDGDRLVVRAKVRHYWEEGGQPPARAGIVLGQQVAWIARELPREWIEIQAAWTLRADDFADSLKFGLIAAAAKAKAGMLVDEVRVSIVAGARGK